MNPAVTLAVRAVITQHVPGAYTNARFGDAGGLAIRSSDLEDGTVTTVHPLARLEAGGRVTLLIRATIIEDSPGYSIVATFGRARTTITVRAAELADGTVIVKARPE